MAVELNIDNISTVMNNLSNYKLDGNEVKHKGFFGKLFDSVLSKFSSGKALVESRKRALLAHLNTALIERTVSNPMNASGAVAAGEKANLAGTMALRIQFHKSFAPYAERGYDEKEYFEAFFDRNYNVTENQDKLIAVAIKSEKGLNTQIGAFLKDLRNEYVRKEVTVVKMDIETALEDCPFRVDVDRLTPHLDKRLTSDESPARAQDAIAFAVANRFSSDAYTYLAKDSEEVKALKLSPKGEKDFLTTARNRLLYAINKDGYDDLAQKTLEGIRRAIQEMEEIQAYEAKKDVHQSAEAKAPAAKAAPVDEEEIPLENLRPTRPDWVE